MKILRATLRQSRKSKHPLQTFAATAFKGGRIQASSINTFKTDPNSRTFFKRRHAEFNLAKKINLQGCNVLVVRVLPDDRLGLAKPCLHCEQILRKAGVKRVYYSTNEQTVEFLRLN